MNESSRQKLMGFFSNYRLDGYKKKQLIMKPGQKVDYVGFIKSGFVRVFTTNNEGEEITIQMFKPMLFFTVIFMLTELTNKYYFEAITPVEVWRAPLKDANNFFRENPDVSNEIMKDFSERFLLMTEQLSRGLSGKALSKVAGAVLSLEKPLRGETDQLAITHRLIASMTGMTRETVTLQMLKLEKDKIIENKNRTIKVLDMERLRMATGGEEVFPDEG